MRHPLLLTFFFASALPAQARPAPTPARPAPTTTISGYVYDSLTDAPARGATVVVDRTSASGVTDSTGHYTIDADSVPDGRYQLSFFHPALDSIGIAPPSRTIVLKDRTSVAVDLAMPSASTVIRSVCPESLRTGGRGLLIGDVRDAETDRPLAGALVVVMWSAMQVGNSTISRMPQALNARTDSDGLYRICGVPPQTQLRSQARLAPKASGWLDLAFPMNGLVVQQFLIGETRTVAAAPPTGAPLAGGAAPATAAAIVVGSSTLLGSVVGGDGTPLEGAQVLLIGSTMTVSAKADARGNFRLSGLPSGTQTVEVRLLSYQPKHYVVNLAPHRQAHLSAMLDARAQVLDPVVTVAKETSPVPGFDERKAHATGVFLNAKQIKDANTISVSDIFRQVPGLLVSYEGSNYIVTTSRQVTQVCPSVQWWVDGVKYDAHDEDMDQLFPPDQLEGIEIYKSALDTPAQFQTGQAQCGTILMWTKRSKMKPKGQPAPPP